jgi:hypothetical protein
MNYNTYKTLPVEQYLEELKQERDRRVYQRTKSLQEALQGYTQMYTSAEDLREVMQRT